MAWFGESFSSFTGHLQNLTKEVLSEASDETKGTSNDIKATKEKLEELEAVCTAQELEITALKKQNAALRRRLEQVHGVEEAAEWGAGAGAGQPSWLTVEQRCDAGYAGRAQQAQQAQAAAPRGHARAHSDVTAVSAKHQERLEKELNDRIQVIEHLQTQLQKVEKDRHLLTQRNSELEREIKQLIKHEEQNPLNSTTADSLVEENHGLQAEVDDANKRIEELEEELLSVRSMCLDQVIDSQVNTSELLSDVDPTRKRIASEVGTQRAEKLRAHQDMINRMIQMGEKTKEPDENVIRLQAEDEKLSVEMVATIHKLGDQEQQELIYGTLKALQIENKVLNVRNAQLEKELITAMKMEGRKGDSEGNHFEFTNDFKPDVKIDLLHEKCLLEEEVKYLKEQLEEKQDMCQSTSSQSTSTEQFDEECSGVKKYIDQVRKLEQELEESKLAMQALLEEKIYFTQELEVMANVVQDLETKVATEKEGRRELESNMEELDQQHQDAIDKLIALRNAELVENEQLKFEVEELKLKVSNKQISAESEIQTDPKELCQQKCHTTQTDCISQCNKQNQTAFIDDSNGSGADSEETMKFDQELSDRILKLINFEIPNYQNNEVPKSLHLVQEIVKIMNDFKWKKDTLERKVTELIRDNKDYQSTITILETECSSMKEHVQRLAGQLVGVSKSSNDPLPTILENAEEIELLEQKNTILEEEVGVLRETRQNLEQDAARVREDREDLLRRIRNLEAELRNRENVQTEMARCAEETTNSLQSALEAAESLRVNAEEKAEFLSNEFEIRIENYEEQLQKFKELVKNLEIANQSLSKDFEEKKKEIADLQNKISVVERDKNSLLQQVDIVAVNHDKIDKYTEEILQIKVSDLQKQIEGTITKERHAEVMRDLDNAHKENMELKLQLGVAVKNLSEVQSLLEVEKNIKDELERRQREAACEAAKYFESLKLIAEMEGEKELLEEELDKQKGLVESLGVQSRNFVEEIKGLKAELAKGLAMLDNRNESIICELQQEKSNLQESLSLAMTTEELLNKELGTLKSHLSMNIEKVHQLQATISPLESRLKETEENRRELMESSLKLSQENEMLINKVSDMECTNLNFIRKIEDLKSLEEDIRIVTEDKRFLSEENSKLKANLFDALNKSMSVIEESIQKESSSGSSCLLESSNLSIHEGKHLEDVLVSKNHEIGDVNVPELHVLVEEYRENLGKLVKENESLLREKTQLEEKFEMTKESVSRISEIIKQKDEEIDGLKIQISQLSAIAHKAEDLNRQLLQAQEFRALAVQEREQLLQTVHAKHQESVQYHGEIQKLSALLTQELAKNQQLASQYNALVQQSNEEKMMINPNHEQDLKELQDLMKVKDDGLQQLCKRLEMKELELQARGMEIETLQHQMEVLCQEKIQLTAAAGRGQQNEDLTTKYNEVLSKYEDEQRRCKQLQNEMEICLGREAALQKELERLRVHLVEIEDMYTQEALRSEEHIKELSGKLQQADDIMKSSTTVYKSANIRANQQVETMQEQARLIAQQRDEVQTKLSVAEDQIARHSAALRNLQAVLEQFQQDRQHEIEAATASVYVQVEAAQKRHNELLGEIASLKAQLYEAKQGLGAASRLGEELEKKTEIVNTLKQEVALMQQKAIKAEEQAKIAGQTMEGKVDKCLAKNVVLGFFLAPTNSKDQVLHVVASVLDFSEDEIKRIQQRLGIVSADGSGGWFKSLLHPGADQAGGNNQSLSEAFVRFLENESIPQPKLMMLPERDKSGSSTQSSARSTPASAQRRSPLLLADVQLPTFAQLPVGRNSSSILKDILKDS